MPAFTILAIISLSAMLGLFGSVGGVLILTPFLLLILPLLAGFNPGAPAAEKLARMFSPDRPPAAAPPWVTFVFLSDRPFGRTGDRAIAPRAPPPSLALI